MKRRNRAVIGTMALLMGALTLWSWFKTPTDYSISERRVLAQLPALTAEAVFSGKFMEDFEAGAQDQFPLRDGFRGLKSAVSLGLFRNLDTDGLYLENGSIGKLEYPMREAMLDHSAQRFRYLYETYLKDLNVYFALVPDKGTYLAEGRLALDCGAVTEYLEERLPEFQFIPLEDLLSAEDYYRTDTHWRQERLGPVADRLAHAMGTELKAGYEIRTSEVPFYGVYYRQLALPVKPDTLCYLTNETLENCVVTGYDTGSAKNLFMYDMDKAAGADPYEMFLSGNQAIVVIENPAATGDRELIVFRDSFGSSLAPLLAEAYGKITLVDIRYVRSEDLGRFIEFGNQDVLFLYSTLLLNNSLGLK